MKRVWEQIAKASAPLSNLAVVLVALLLGGVVVSTHLERLRNSKVSLTVGQTVSLDHYHWAEHRRTYILAVHSSCKSCWDSIPFARDLLTHAGMPGGNAVVLVFPLEDDHDAEFVRSVGHDVGHLKANFTAVGIKQTPTLMEVNSSGQLVRYWQGVFEGKGAEKVIQQILKEG
jgi:hypothetical protein